MLPLRVGYLNATMNRTTRNADQEIGPDMSSQTRRNPWVGWYECRFGLPRCSGSGFWMGLELNQPVVPVGTRTAGRLPGPVTNTTHVVPLLLCSCLLYHHNISTPNSSFSNVIIVTLYPLPQLCMMHFTIASWGFLRSLL